MKISDVVQSKSHMYRLTDGPQGKDRLCCMCSNAVNQPGLRLVLAAVVASLTSDQVLLTANHEAGWHLNSSKPPHAMAAAAERRIQSRGGSRFL